MSETLRSSENLNHNKPLNHSGALPRLDSAQIVELMEARKKTLEEIKPNISRKFYYAIEEKLTNEEKRLNEILDWQEGKLSRLSKYTLILDTHYFEQEFLN